MAARGPWSVKGIDAKAREAALQAARNEGITLGDYLNRLLLDAEAEDQSMRSADQRYEQGSQPQASNDGAPSAGNIALEALTRRIEAAEARSTLAITGIDQSVVGLLARLDNSDTARSAMEGRLELAAEQIREAQQTLGERIGRMEADDTGPQSLRALRSLEVALERMATRIADQKEVAAETKKQISSVEDRVFNLTDHVDTSLAATSDRLTKAIEDSELRAQGASRHISERMSQLEEDLFQEKRDLSERFDKLDNGIGSTLTKASEHIERFGGRIAQTESQIMNARAEIDNQGAAVSDFAERLTRAETTTDAALRDLDQHFTRLDQRLGQIDKDIGGNSIADLKTELENRMKTVAQDLADTISDIREELAEQIEAASSAPVEAFAEINNAVAEMHRRMKKAEKRQSDAIEAIGGEFAKLTQSLDRRVSTIEKRNDSDLTSTVRDQIDNLSNAMSQRLNLLEARDGTGDGLNAISEQMNKLAEVLDKRVNDSEERSAAAIRDFTEHVSTLTRKLSAKQDQGLEQISGQIRESEKRQSQKFEQALSGVKDRIAQVEEATATSISPIQKAMSSLAERLQAVEDFASPPGAPRSESMDFGLPTFEDTLQSTSSKTAKAAKPVEEDWSSPIAKKSGFADIPDIPDVDTNHNKGKSSSAVSEDDDEFDPWGGDSDAFNPPHSAFGEPDEDTGLTADLPHADDAFDLNAAEDDFEQFDAGFRASPAAEDYLARARAAAKAGHDHSPRAKKSDKKRSGGSSKVPLVAAASVLALTAAGTAGYMMMRGKQEASYDQFVSVPLEEKFETGEAPGSTAEAPVLPEPFDPDAETTPAEGETAETEAETTAPAEIKAEPKKQSPPPLTPLEPPARPQPAPVQTAKAAPAPAPLAEPKRSEPARTETRQPRAEATPQPQPVAVTPPAPSGSVAQYKQGMEALDAGRIAEGAQLIQAAAQAGEPIAQYRLSKLYERGQGVPRDIQQSRAWTEKAAENGNVKAMHDLAVFYAEGEGGQQSYVGAVQWFRQAADHGLVDSQFNLGVLYEQGLGVTANPAEALYWFRVAAKLGDSAAGAKVSELVELVSPEDAQKTALLAGRYRAKAGDPIANGRFS